MQKRAVVQDSNNPNNTYSELAGTVEPHALKARGVSRVACMYDIPSFSTAWAVQQDPIRKKREKQPPPLFFSLLELFKTGAVVANLVRDHKITMFIRLA